MERKGVCWRATLFVVLLLFGAFSVVLATNTVAAFPATYTDPSGNIWTYADADITAWAIGTGTYTVTVPANNGAGQTFTSIGSNCFSPGDVGAAITSCSIPSTITSIGENAFYECTSLTSVNIPNSVTTIGRLAFYNCILLTSVTIPSSVTMIDEGAFTSCTALTEIVVDAGNPNYSNDAGDGLLYNKARTTLIQYPIGNARTSFTIVGGVTTIGEAAFAYCDSLTSVTMPNSVTSIGVWAFYGCIGLTSVAIPNSVTTIGNGAFELCSDLISVSIGSGVTVIGFQAFFDCGALTSITFYGLVAPTISGGVESNWLGGTPETIRGHAYAASNFPAPDGYFNGLMMGAVIPLALDHFDVAIAGTLSFTAGVPWITSNNVVVTAHDASSNVVTSYTGSPVWSASCAGTLPAAHAFVLGTWTFASTGFSLNIAGSQAITITDTELLKSGTRSGITILPSVLDHFTVEGIADPVVAGTLTTVTITAYDSYNNIKTDYTGWVTFTSSDTGATLPSSYHFTSGVIMSAPSASVGSYDNGIHTFANGVRLTTTGEQWVKATDTVTAIWGQQSDISVTPGAFASFTMTGQPSSCTAGISWTFGVVVTALDTFGNRKTNYLGQVYFTSTDGAAMLPYSVGSKYTFNSDDSGQKTFPGSGFTLKTAPSQTVTITDGAVSFVSGAITVNPGVLSYFTMTGTPASCTAGTPWIANVLVTAFDAYGNRKTNYLGQVYFTSTDGAAVLPYSVGSKYTFNSDDSGQKTFPGSGFTLKTAPSQTVTITDGAVSFVSGAITVNPGPLASFTMTGTPASCTAGIAWTTEVNDVLVTAWDAYGNRKTNYLGQVYFTSTDGAAVLPYVVGSKYTFNSDDSGQKTFPGSGFTLKTAPSQTITVTDGELSRASGTIAVNPGALSYFTMTGTPASCTAGIAWTTEVNDVQVTAWDAYGNRKTNYVGQVYFTSTDVAAVLPYSVGFKYTFISDDGGQKTFPGSGFTLKTTPSQTITITDGTTSLSSGAIVVTPGALHHFTMAGFPAVVMAGVTFSGATVVAFDQYGNIKTDYTGTVHFASSDPHPATLPADHAFIGADNGQHMFNGFVLFKTPSQTITVSDTVLPVFLTSAAIAVTPAALNHFTVTGIADPVIAGTPTSPTVVAFDVYDNIKTDYVGSVHFTSDDVKESTLLPDDYAFLLADHGVKTFIYGATLTTTGIKYVKVWDTLDNSKYGQQSVVVNHALAASILLDPAASIIVAGASQAFTVMGTDAYGNSWDVTSECTFAIPAGAGGSWTLNVYTSEHAAASWTVTGTYVPIYEVTGTAALTVTPAALSYFTMSGIADPVVAGTPTSPTVTAFDAYGNIKTDYVGTVHFTSDDVKGSTALPGDYTFTTGLSPGAPGGSVPDNGRHVFSGGAILTTTGIKYVKVWDKVDNEKYGQQSVVVTPAALASFTMTGTPASCTAGMAWTTEVNDVVVTAWDAYGNRKTNYVGQVYFTSTDGAAVLPYVIGSKYTFIADDSGQKVFPAAGFMLKTAPSQTVTITNGEVLFVSGVIAVDPGALHHFTMSGIADPVVAGAPSTLTIIAFDAYGNIKTDYAGTVHFTSTDMKGSTVLPSDYTFTTDAIASAPFSEESYDNGVHAFIDGVMLTTTGEQSVMATDLSTAAWGEQTVTTTHAIAASMMLDPTIANIVAGALQEYTATAADAYDNLWDVTATTAFEIDPGAAGSWTGSTYASVKAGSWTVTGTCGGITDTASLTVRHDSAISISIAPDRSTITAGTLQEYTAIAADAYGNHWVVTATTAFEIDPGAAGSWTGSTYASAKAGSWTVTGTCEGITDTASLTVRHASARTLVIAPSNGNITAGTYQEYSAIAADAYDNLWDATATTSFEIDSRAGGNWTANVYRSQTAGVAWTVNGTEQVSGIKATALLTVTHSVLDHFDVEVGGSPMSQEAGAFWTTTANDVLVTARDEYDNVVTNYSGIPIWSASCAGTLPTAHALEAGIHIFAATAFSLNVVGEQTLIVTDGAVLGISVVVAITPGPIDHFTVTGIVDPAMAGTATSPVVTAFDAYGNVKTDYLGTVHFSSDDVKATTILPTDHAFNAGDAGVHIFARGVVLTTAGDMYVQVQDTIAVAAAGQQNVVVIPAAISYFTVAGIRDPLVAGTQTTPTVTAYDVFNNIKTNYVGTVHFTSTDTKRGTLLPGDYTFTSGVGASAPIGVPDNGIHTFTNGVTLTTIGEQSARVTDVVMTAAFGEQSHITVCTIPNAPSGLTAVAGNAQVSLNWTAPADDGGSGVVGYRLYRSTTSDGSYSLIASPSGTVYVDIGRSNGQAYWYNVSAVNAAGEGVKTSPISSTPFTVPNAPRGFSVSAGSAQAVLSWTVPAFDGGSVITGYRIYFGTTPMPSVLFSTVGNNTFSTAVTGIVPGILYYFAVKAMNAAGDSVLSDVLSAIPYTTSEAPRLSSAVPSTIITLTWTAPANTGFTPLVGYKVFYGTATPDQQFGGTQEASTLSMNVTGLTPGIRYYFGIKAVNAAGDSLLSNILSGIVASVPGAPTITNVSVGTSFVSLVWTAPADDGGSSVTGYHVYRSITGTYILVATTEGLSYTDSGLTNGRTYYYRVSAENAIGEGFPSTSVSATPVSEFEYRSINNGTQIEITGYHGAGGNVTIPGMIDGLPVTSIGENAFEQIDNLITVTIPSGVTFIGDGAFSSGGSLVAIIVDAANQDYISVDGVLYNRDMTELIQYPGGRVGEFLMPGSVVAIRSGAFRYCSLTSVIIPASVSIIGSEAFLGCSSLTSITFLGMVAPVTVGSDWILGTPVTIRGHAYLDSAFPPPGGAFHGLIMGSLLPVVPGPPTDLSAVPGNASIVLSWQAPRSDGGSVILYYEVFRSASSGGAYVLIASPSGLNHTDSSLINGREYWYQIGAVNAEGEGPLSSSINATPCTVPDAPTALLTAAGNGQVVLSWTAPAFNGGSVIDYYVIYRDGVDAAHSNTTSVTISGLNNGQNYSFTVAAHNRAGIGPMIAAVFCTPIQSGDKTGEALSLTAAVILSAGLALLAALGSQVASGASGAMGPLVSAANSLWGLINKFIDFILGYLREHLASNAYKQLNKVELEKGVVRERKSFMAGFSLRELVVTLLSSVVLGITYLVANRMEVLQPSNLLLYIVVAGFALVMHDLTHRYVAWKCHATTEYQFWWLGTGIMFLTAGLFNVVYAQPSRLSVDETNKLTARQEALIYGAGPMMSFVLFLAFALLLPLGGTLLTIGLLACSMNLLTAVYNLMPFKPMDGMYVRKWSTKVWALTFFPLLLLYFVMMIYVF